MRHIKRVILIFIGMSLFAISCSKDEIDTKWYNATVIGKGLDCSNTFLIQFDEDVMGSSNTISNKTFYAINLPEKCKVPEMKIKVEFRVPNNSETIVCTAMGIGYPQIYITKVIPK